MIALQQDRSAAVGTCGGNWPIVTPPWPPEIQAAGRVFRIARWQQPYPGIAQQYREAVPSDSAHLMVGTNGRWWIAHVDRANPDAGGVVAHFFEVPQVRHAKAGAVALACMRLLGGGIPGLIGGFAGWEAWWWAAQKTERSRAYALATDAAKRRGKPLLIVGEPDEEYPCPKGRGDRVVDLRPRSVCASYQRANVEDLWQFHDQQFGAVLASFTVEHTCHPDRTMRELHRVSDEVFVVYPYPWRASGRLVPGRSWTVRETTPGVLTFSPIAGHGCNQPSRYGRSRT